MQNSDFRNRNASFCVSLNSPVVLARKTSTLGPELQVSIGPSPHLWICASKTVGLAPDLHDSMCPRPHLWSCAHKPASLAPE